MFLFPINIPNFRFSPSKMFLRLLVPIKSTITTFGPYFYIKSCIFFNEVVHKCVEYCKNLSPKKLDFINKT